MRRALALLCLLLALPARAGERAFQPGVALVAVSDGRFDRPHDLALSPDGRFLLVADLGNDVVKVLDPATLAALARFGAGELSSPHDVAFMGPSTVLVADTANDRIAVYDFRGVGADGEALARLTASWTDGPSNPEGVAAAGPDGPVYVGNVGDGSVLKLDDKGRRLGRAGGGDGPLTFSNPHDVAVHRDGRLFVADSGNDRIRVLTADLALIRDLKGPPYDFHEPKYMAFDAQDRLYLADEYSSRVKVMASDLSLVRVIGTGVKGDGPGQLNWPEGVEVRSETVWVSDTYNDRILRLRLQER